MFSVHAVREEIFHDGLIACGGGGGVVAGDGGAQRLCGKIFCGARLFKGADVLLRLVKLLGAAVVFDLDEPVERAQLLALAIEGLAEGIPVGFCFGKLRFQLPGARFERVVFLERALQGSVAALDFVADGLTAALIHEKCP